MDQLLRSVRDDWQSIADQNGIELRVVNSSARIVSDPRALATILGNLVGNAIKYTRSGKVLVGCLRRRTHPTLLVCDSGIGIASDKQREIFNAFTQLDRNSEGFGLGLSIVRDTAELLELPINFRSQLNRGTAIGVDIPYASPAS